MNNDNNKKRKTMLLLLLILLSIVIDLGISVAVINTNLKKNNNTILDEAVAENENIENKAEDNIEDYVEETTETKETIKDNYAEGIIKKEFSEEDVSDSYFIEEDNSISDKTTYNTTNKTSNSGNTNKSLVAANVDDDSSTNKKNKTGTTVIISKNTDTSESTTTKSSSSTNNTSSQSSSSQSSSQNTEQKQTVVILNSLKNTDYNIEVKEVVENALGDAKKVNVEDESENTLETIVDTIVRKEDLTGKDIQMTTLDIELVNGKNQEVQPNGAVKVYMDIPTGMDKDTFALYYIGENGSDTPVKVVGKIENDKFVFYRNHFCHFCLVSEYNIERGQDSALGLANLGWFVDDADADTFYITTGADLRGLILLTKGNVKYIKSTGFVSDSGQMTALQNSFEGKTIVLANNITMSDIAMSGIGSDTYPFKGCFDGNGYTISNLHLENDSSYGGIALINNLGAAGEVRNIGLKALNISAALSNNYKAAGFIATNSGKLTNVYLYNSSISVLGSGSNVKIAGLVADNKESATVKNCYVYSNTITAYTGLIDNMVATTLLQTQYENLFSDETESTAGNTYIKIYSDNSVTPSEENYAFIDSVATKGLAYQLSDFVINKNQELSKENYITWKNVSNSIPTFTGEKIKNYLTVNAKIVLNGELSSVPGKISIDGKVIGAIASAIKYAGYEGPVFSAPSTNNNYTFKGWYSDISGEANYLLTTSREFSVTRYAEATYYAVYTGGPFSLKLEAVSIDKNNLENTNGKVFGGSQKETDALRVQELSVERKSYVTVHAIPGEGESFVRWEQVTTTTETDSSTGEEKTIETLKTVSTSKENNCAYVYTANKDNGYLRAVFDAGVNIKVAFTSDSSSQMGSVTNINSTATKRGEQFEVSATPKTGYVFVGWYEVQAGTGDPVSTDKTYTATLPNDYAENEITLYAKFRAGATATASVKGESGVIEIRDEGATLKKVVYQYSGSTAYSFISWLQYTRNGKGLDLNGNPKSDYEENTSAYTWNTTEGYQTVTKGLTNYDLIVEYAGWYTLLLYTSDKDFTVSTLEITQEDLQGELVVPGVTKKYTTLTINPNGQAIIQAYYQLTSTDTTAETCPVAYTTWTNYLKTGKLEAVIGINGSNGYRVMSKNTDTGVTSTKVSVAGWYTVFIKYGNNNQRVVYVKVTEKDIEDGKGGIITVLANYSLGADVNAVFSVRTPEVEAATEYGLIIEDSYGIKNIIKSRGSFHNKNYLVYATKLIAGATYKLTPYSIVNNVYVDNGSTVSFVAAKETVAVTNNTNTYYAREVNGIAYRISNLNGLGRIDVLGKNNILTSKNNTGWGLYIGDNQEYSSFGEDENITIIPTVAYVRGISGTEYVQLKYILRNNTDTAISNYKMAISADTQIGSVDKTPVTRTKYGATMSDGATNILAVIANGDVNVDGLEKSTTTATSLYAGDYSEADKTTYRYTDTAVNTSTQDNADSAIITAWNNISLNSGEVKEINVIIGVVVAGTLIENPLVPKVNVENGHFELTACSSDEQDNITENIYYAYVSSNTTLANSPFTYDTATNDINTLKTQGLLYKGINGEEGYRTLSGELIEEGDDKNNIIEYEEPGWYTFVFNYICRTYTNPNDKTSGYTDGQRCVAVNIKVTENDLYGKPILKKYGNTFVIYDNSSNLQSMTYQLSDVDQTKNTPYTYTTWNDFVRNGQGLTSKGTNRDNKATYIKVNGSEGYKGEDIKALIEKNPDTRSFSYTVTTAGWYTVLLQYKDPGGNKKYLYKYILFTDEDVNIEGPILEKNHNEITFIDNNSSLTRAYIQLTTTDFDTYDTEDKLKNTYGYGTGKLYTTVGTNQYKSSDYMSDFQVFSRIGQYSSIDEIASGTKNTLLKSINGEDGYQRFYYKKMDGKSYRFNYAGWYTVLCDYGDGYSVARYVQILEQDLTHAPEVTINTDTGVVTLNTNETDVKSAYIQYTYPYSGEESFPAAALTYIGSWYKYWSHGQDIEPDFNGVNGYKKIDMQSGKNITGTTAVYKPGWYTIYLKEAGGDRTITFKLEASPETQPGFTQINQCMAVTYTDSITDENNPITKYAFGYIGPDSSYLPENQTTAYDMNSVYRMTKACGNNKIYSVTKKYTDRTFTLPVDKKGYYAVMVTDHYYGTAFYTVYVDDTNVIIHDTEDENTPRLKVSGKQITAIKDTTNGKIHYIKMVDTEEGYIRDYTKGNVVKAYKGGNQQVLTIDESGRVYKVKVVLNAVTGNTDELEEIRKQCQQVMTGLTGISEQAYKTINVPGRYGIDTYVTQMTELLNEYSELIENENGTQKEIDELTNSMKLAYKELIKNIKEVETDFVSVAGQTITITIPDNYDLEYIVYNVQKYTVIEADSAPSYKPPLAVVWQDWVGIAENEYYKIPVVEDRKFVLENVDDGIYTFMIKVSQTVNNIKSEYVYFRNPIVSTNMEDISFAIYEISGSSDSVINKAQKLLDSVIKESEKTDENDTYVSDTLYDALKKEIATAKKLVTNTASRINKNKATNADTENIVNEIANLNTIMRKAKAGLVKKDNTEQTLQLICEDAATGKYILKNPEKGLTNVKLARGYFDTWDNFSKTFYENYNVNINSDDIKYSSFYVTGNGNYTLYCKFSNGNYEFLHFKEEGYSVETLSVTSNGVNIYITISEDKLSSVNTLAYIGEYSTKYNWTKYKKITMTEASVTVPVLSNKDHTIYAVIAGQEHYIYTSVTDIPVIKTGDCSTEGMMVKAITTEANTAWVAYAIGEYNSFNQMLQGNTAKYESGYHESYDGIRFMAQNENVLIKSWTDSTVPYTFFFKGSNNNSDYITTVWGENNAASTQIDNSE